MLLQKIAVEAGLLSGWVYNEDEAIEREMRSDSPEYFAPDDTLSEPLDFQIACPPSTDDEWEAAVERFESRRKVREDQEWLARQERRAA